MTRLPHGEALPLPTYETPDSAGMDLRAATDGPMEIPPLHRLLVPTGLTLEIPPGFEGQVRPRSGLALREGLTVLNTPGTIDADYRGEVKVILINLGPEPIVIAPGQRIAQLVLAPVARAMLVECDALGETGRGTGGFGHTGKE